ncbi:MAG: T9SS type A sorting domain-containing protein [Bacteroidales bacterium]|nr:T9SS type A sorting domain-containing protein [Bacteroidales bacterium]
MKKNALILTLLCFVSSLSFAQLQEGGIPESFNMSDNLFDDIKTYYYNFDNSQIKAKNDSALDIGVAESVMINFIDEATKTIGEDSTKIYRLAIEVNNVYGIGLYFDDFHLPTNGKLYIYNEDKSIVLGAYTANSINESKTLAIPPLPGNKIIIEYNGYSNIEKHTLITIKRIAKIYRPVFEYNFIDRDSDCFKDVYCNSSYDIYRSVARMKFFDTTDDTYYLCSCALVNQDVPYNNLKAYVLTANHCGKNADLYDNTFYFNYQYSTCGGTLPALGNYTLQGFTKKAKQTLTDMFLLELNTFPYPDYNVHFAGWDRSTYSDLSDSDVIGVHHPHGMPKKISIGGLAANTLSDFWRVQWYAYPTEKGSSGSPLFDVTNKRIIGWLSSGFSKCSNIDGIDQYGKLRKAWTSTLGSDNRLKDWLDPNDNDSNELDGRDPCFTNLLIQGRTFYPANEYQPNNQVNIRAGNKIETSGNVVIKSGSEYNFVAGQRIVFNTGTKIEQGAKFSASISSTPCGTSTRYDDNSAQELENKNITNLENVDKKQLLISAYPNPANDIVTIEYTINDNAYVSIDLYDINANLISNIENNKHLEGTYTTTFDMNGLTPGIYCILLRTEYNSSYYKIIKINH